MIPIPKFQLILAVFAVLLFLGIEVWVQQKPKAMPPARSPILAETTQSGKLPKLCTSRTGSYSEGAMIKNDDETIVTCRDGKWVPTATPK